MGIQKYEWNTGGQKFRHILATHEWSIKVAQANILWQTTVLAVLQTQTIQTTQLVTHDEWEEE
jgi:hypothetical protein